MLVDIIEANPDLNVILQGLFQQVPFLIASVFFVDLHLDACTVIHIRSTVQWYSVGSAILKSDIGFSWE